MDAHECSQTDIGMYTYITSQASVIRIDRGETENIQPHGDKLQTCRTEKSVEIM
jgi:hypothetical protein